MQTFVTLYRFTGAVKGGGPERFQKFKALYEAEGGRMERFCGLMGSYDVLTIASFPNVRCAMKGAAAVCNLICARSMTMPALDEPDFLLLLTELG